MNKARITRPDKTAMQAGRAKMRWLLTFEPATPYFVDPLMGWTGMRDTTRQVTLEFPSRETAIAYAKANGIPYEVAEPRRRSQIKKAYADNFSFKKAQ